MKGQRNAAPTVRNVKVYAKAAPKGLDLYLDFSGQREYLMRCRFHPVLYRYLKPGVRIETLRRDCRTGVNTVLPSGRRITDRGAVHSASHVLRCAEDYLKYEYGAA